MSASPSSEPHVEPRSSARPLLILLIAICTLMIVTYAARLGERDDVQQQIVEQTALNEQARARTAALQKDLVDVKKPSYVDEVARMHLGLGKEGDVVIVAVASGAPATMPGQPAADTPFLFKPIWRQWLTLFTPDS